MKRKNLMLTVAAAAVLGAFNPAFAGGGAKHGSAEELSAPSARTEQSAEQSASSSIGSSTQSPSTEGSSASPSIGANAGADVDVNAGLSGSAPFGNSDMTLGGNVGAQTGASADRGQDPDKLTGLDRAHPAN